MPKSRTFYTASSKPLILHCVDCLDGMQTIMPESIDLIVTSPPYNLGIKYSTYKDNKSRDDYLEWIKDWTTVVFECLSPKGSLFLNVGSAPKDPFIAMDVARQVSRCFILQNTLHWIKSISVDPEHIKEKFPVKEAVNFGHFKPVNSDRYVNDCHEFIFHFTRNGDVSIDRKGIGVPYTHKSNIKRWKSVNSDRRCRGNTWFVPYKTILSRAKDRPHPATFPKELVERCIRLHGINRTTRVLDPFMGIGTTAVVCADLDLEFIGYEIDNDYFSESIRQLEQRLTLHTKHLLI
jgi:site-specific DNA-methyltransferase (adenine-specific)